MWSAEWKIKERRWVEWLPSSPYSFIIFISPLIFSFTLFFKVTLTLEEHRIWCFKGTNVSNGWDISAAEIVLSTAICICLWPVTTTAVLLWSCSMHWYETCSVCVFLFFPPRCDERRDQAESEAKFHLMLFTWLWPLGCLCSVQFICSNVPTYRRSQ